MAAVTVTGVVRAAGVRTVPDIYGTDRYDAREGRERYLVRLGVRVETADGKLYIFDSPAVRKSVRSAGGAAVVIYHLDNAAEWFRVTDGSGVATPERAETRRCEPLVKTGDTITVRGSVKSATDRYTVLNRVRMVTPGAGG